MQRAQFIEGNFSYKWASSTIIEYSTLLQCIVRMHADIKNHFKCFAMCSLARYLWMWIFSTHKYKHVIFCYERQKKTGKKPATNMIHFTLSLTACVSAVVSFSLLLLMMLCWICSNPKRFGIHYVRIQLDSFKRFWILFECSLSLSPSILPSVLYITPHPANNNKMIFIGIVRQKATYYHIAFTSRMLMTYSY